MGNGRGWGEDATLFPDFDRIRGAAIKAFKDPETWVPAAGAAVFSLGNLDERVSDWASDKTPLFGSLENAENGSNYLLTATNAGAILTSLATPSGQEPGVWVSSKLKGLSVEVVAYTSANQVTGGLKRLTDRKRPDGSNRMSFPSGHSTQAFASAALGVRNLDSLALSERERVTLHAGFTMLAVGDAWARIEAKKHFPSDVLAGAAIGNFVATFVHDAFLGLDQSEGLEVLVEPSKDSLILEINFRF